MKLSEILGWPNKRKETEPYNQYANIQFNTALESCDREIDREALIKVMFEIDSSCCPPVLAAEHIISTMPTWLKRIKKK